MGIIVFIILIVLLAVEAESGFKRTKKLFKNPVKVKDHPLIIYLGIFVFLVSSIFTISGWGLNFLERADNWLFYKEHQYETLRSLYTESDINYFKNKLGTPVFINENGSNTNIEYIFINKYYFLQAITTKQGKVLFYSVTSRSPDFNPKYDSQSDLVFTLGKTKFSEINSEPKDISVFLGARRYFYNELYYLGNPGLYQTYFVADNDAGWNRDFIDVLEKYPPEKLSVPEKYEWEGSNLKKVRGENIINTYGVLAPNLIVEYLSDGVNGKAEDMNDWINKHLGFQMGVDMDQLRLLNEEFYKPQGIKPKK